MVSKLTNSALLPIMCLFVCFLSAQPLLADATPIPTEPTYTSSDLVQGKWQATWAKTRYDCPKYYTPWDKEQTITIHVDDSGDIIIGGKRNNLQYVSDGNGAYVRTANDQFTVGSQNWNSTTTYTLTVVSPTEMVDEWLIIDTRGSDNCKYTNTVTLELVDEKVQCIARSFDGANLRTGPGSDFKRGGTIGPGTEPVLDVVGQSRKDAQGFIWWQFSNSLWAREDVITVTGQCDTLPTISS